MIRKPTEQYEIHEVGRARELPKFPGIVLAFVDVDLDCYHVATRDYKYIVDETYNGIKELLDGGYSLDSIQHIGILEMKDEYRVRIRGTRPATLEERDKWFYNTGLWTENPNRAK